MNPETNKAITPNASPLPRVYAAHYTAPERFDFHHPLVEFRDRFAADMAALLCIRSMYVAMGDCLTVYHVHDAFGPELKHTYSRLECLHDLGREQIEQMFDAPVRLSPRTCQHLLALYEATEASDETYEGNTPPVSTSCAETLSVLRHLLVDPAKHELFLVLTPAWFEASPSN